MFIKIIYVLFFALADLMVYSMLHKTGKMHTRLQWFFCFVFLLVVLMEMGLFHVGFLLPWKQFFPPTILLAVPLVTYLWYNYMIVNRMGRLKERSKPSGHNFFNMGMKVFSFIFLKLIYLIVLVVQGVLVFKPAILLR